MIHNYIQMLALPCAGKSTYINKHYPNAIHIIEEFSKSKDFIGFSVEKFIDYCKEYFNKKHIEASHSVICTIETKEPTYDMFIIAADEIKKLLPGYTPEHPEVVHETSVQLAKQCIFELATQGIGFTCDVLLDGGGINNHYNLSIIEYLRTQNVNKIICLFFDTPVEVCLKRLEKRERKVPIEDIYKKNLKIEVCKNRYIPLVDEFIRIDYFTNKYLMLDMDGTLACYGKAKLDIHGNSDFVSSELFKNLKPVKHVIEFVKEHYGSNMENVYIITACANSIAWEEKNEWLDKYFPEIPVKNRLFVGNKNYKHVFIEQFAYKMKWKVQDVTIIDDFHDTLAKCNTIGINAVHPSNIYALFDKYSYQA